MSDISVPTPQENFPYTKAEISQDCRAVGAEMSQICRDTGAKISQDCKDSRAEISQNCQDIGPEISQDRRDTGAQISQEIAEISQDCRAIGAEMSQICRDIGAKISQDCKDSRAEISQNCQDIGPEISQDRRDTGAQISQEMSAKRLLKVCQFAKEEFQERENVFNAKQSQCEDTSADLSVIQRNSDLRRKLSEDSGQKNTERDIKKMALVNTLYSDSLEDAESDGDELQIILGHNIESKDGLVPVIQESQSSSSTDKGGLSQEEPNFKKNDSCFDLKNIEDYFPTSEAGKVDISINDKHRQQSGSFLPASSLNKQPEKRNTLIEKQDNSSPPVGIAQNNMKSLQYWVKQFSSILIEHLNKFGICVIDNFFGEARGSKILYEVIAMRENTPFKAGTLSQDLSNLSVRSDVICWIDAINPPCPAIRSMLNLIDAIVLMANKTPENGDLGKYRINGRTKAMVACYPGRGTHYVRHVDNPNKDGRCITTIYYLNKNWMKEHGGKLMIYPSHPVGAVASVDPIFDRVIFFWSDRRNPHEVLPAYRPRYAITTWYFDSEEKNEYMKRQETSAQK